jgi:CspA family cold shock protein
VRLTGRVKWFNNGRGRGVIQTDQGDSLPVQAAAIQGAALAGLEPGQVVEFEIARGPGGPHADRVVPIVRPPDAG